MLKVRSVVFLGSWESTESNLILSKSYKKFCQSNSIERLTIEGVSPVDESEISLVGIPE
jgi:hypothetical protein